MPIWWGYSHAREMVCLKRTPAGLARRLRAGKRQIELDDYGGIQFFQEFYAFFLEDSDARVRHH